MALYLFVQVFLDLRVAASLSISVMCYSTSVLHICVEFTVWFFVVLGTWCRLSSCWLLACAACCFAPSAACH